MAITSARMQIKRGNEVDFDAEKMLVGEWALSTDKRIVRICVAPNVCIRMATYDAFEVDMAQIQKILEECQTIEDAVKLINSQVSEKLQATIEYTNQAKQYRDEAEQFRNEAEAFAPDGYEELKETVASNTAKIDTIIEKAELNIKNTASGSHIHLTDSANGKAVDFGLYGKAEQKQYSGKNLLQNTATSKTVNGVTFTVNNEGSVTANGTATNHAVFDIPITLEDGVSYTASGINGSSDSTYQVYLQKSDSTMTNAGYMVNGEKTFTKDSDKYNVAIYRIRVSSGATVNTTIYPMIRLASITDSAYEPYTNGPSPNPDYPQEITVAGSDGSVGVVSCGKNVIDQVCVPILDTLANTHFLNSGIYTITRDSSESGKMWFFGAFDENGSVITESALQAQSCSLNGSKEYYYGAENLDTVKITLNVDCYFKVGVLNGLGTTYFMMSKGDKYEPYEPYKETTSTIPTPNGLAGIKVSSGGNYTDENGQMWVCDEIVKYADGTGKYVQRIGKEVLNGSEDWSLNTINDYGISNFNTKPKNTAGNTQISSHFIYDGRSISLVDSPSFNVTSANIFLRMKSSDISSVEALKTWLASNNVSIMYELAEPIITDLSAEEIAEIEKLYTFYPVTNITNDAKCGMSITYFADAKNYIDQRLALIESAMLNNI